MDVIVEYDYNAQNDDELTIKKGDKIKNAIKKEEGWMEGELNGKKGLFPDNFVKFVKKTTTTQNEKRKNFFTDLSNKFINSDKKSLPNNNNNNTTQISSPIPVSTSPKPPAKPTKINTELFKAKVIYSYTPVNEDELAIQENQIVEVIRLVEDGWYEGICNGKKGVFPSNYVNKIENINNNENKSITLSSSDDMEIEDNKPKNKKVVGGVGLGNIFSGKPIELKTTKLNPAAQNGQQTYILPQPPSAFKEKVVSKARVVFSYTPTQPDELQLQVGEIVNILDKELEDEGWWKGELNGKIGVFPDNFVEEINNITNNSSNGEKKMAFGEKSPKDDYKPQQTVINTNTPATTVRHSNNNLNFNEIINGHSGRNEHDIDNINTNDDSMRVDDLQTDNKLTHMKKARQINKRPPSFRFKNKGEKIEDADTLLQQVQPSNDAQNGITQQPKPATPPQITNEPPMKISPTNMEKKFDEFDSSAPIKNVIKTPSPPPYSTSINSTHNEETTQLKQEIETLKRTTEQITNDYKQLQNETRTQKQYYDEQLQKLQKVLKDLVEEIDEEKKTRLALQVELERIKKNIKPF